MVWLYDIMVHVIIINQIGRRGRVVGWHNSKQQFAGSNPPTAGFFSMKKLTSLCSIAITPYKERYV